MNSRKEIKDKKKYMLFSQLYSLLHSGLDFSHSFQLLIEGEPKRRERDMLKAVYGKVVIGHEFWRSMQLIGGFTDLDCGVIRVGEETGKIGHALQFLSDYYQKRNEQRRMLVSALSYPVIIILTACLVLFFMIAVVVPMFEQVYARMGSNLPEITRWVIRLSEHFPVFFTTTGLIVLLGVGVRLLYGKTEQYQAFTSGFVMRIPLVGKLIRKHYEVLFCRLMHLLLSSDVPLLHSLHILEQIIGFYPYRKSFADMAAGLKKGVSFSDNMERHTVIYGHKLAILVRVGEETNSLAAILDRQSADVTAELEHELKQLGNLLEPLLILGVGIVVAVILIAMYMPMFQLGQTIA